VTAAIAARRTPALSRTAHGSPDLWPERRALGAPGKDPVFGWACCSASPFAGARPVAERQETEIVAAARFVIDLRRADVAVAREDREIGDTVTAPTARTSCPDRQPEEIGGPPPTLASDAASFMTGQCLTLDGGYTCGECRSVCPALPHDLRKGR